MELFDRVKNRVVLNEYGKEFYERISKAIYLIDSGVESLKVTPDSENGVISVIVKAGQYLFPPLYDAFSKTHPNIILDVANYSLMQRKLMIEYDFHITATMNSYNDIDFEYKYPDPTHGYGKNGLKEVITLREAIGDLENNPGEYFTGSYSSIFMSRNRKKLWNQPSFTIQASGRQTPIHPSGTPMKHVGKDKYIFGDGEENNRRLSVKEIARIQTFPDDFIFIDDSLKDIVAMYKVIGNAVPCHLAEVIANAIYEQAFKKEEE